MSSHHVAAVFSPSLPELCADQLRRAIVRGELAAGQRLPSEERLSADLGVARLTLRSALTRLVGEDLLEVRHGSGYTVRPYLASGSPKVLAEVVAVGAEQGKTLEIARELLRVRRHLAAALVERLAEVPVDLGAAFEAHRAFAALVAAQAPAERLADADADLLAALVSATGSPVLQLCLQPIRQILAKNQALRAAMYARPEANAAAWSLFLRALASGELAAGPLLALLAQRDAETLARLAQP
jgi:GntR family transcriptional repressor for pyruvate dehydrogenase complex